MRKTKKLLRFMVQGLVGIGLTQPQPLDICTRGCSGAKAYGYLSFTPILTITASGSELGSITVPDGVSPTAMKRFIGISI